MINFRKYSNMTDCIIPDGVTLSSTSFIGRFSSMKNLRRVVLPSNVSNLYQTFWSCTNLTTAVCGPKVTNMSYTYYGCINLTTAVCGPEVTDMSSAYNSCKGLTSAACGNNVVNMYTAYSNCTNLTTAVCGPKVTNMVGAYQICTNLTTAVCGPKVTNMTYAYSGCSLQGNMYIHSPSIVNFVRCFYGHNSSNRLNIYVPNNSLSHIYLTARTDRNSPVGDYISWLNAENHQYNTKYNIYIYPVANVEEARIANGDPDYMGNP